MAIYITDKDGNDQHFDTIEEFERAMIFMARLGGNKPPQDLVDEVKERDSEALEKERLTDFIIGKAKDGGMHEITLHHYDSELESAKDSQTEFKAGDIVRATEDVVGFGGQYVSCNVGELLEVQIGGTGAMCLVKESWKCAYVSENLANIELVCRKEDRKDVEL